MTAETVEFKPRVYPVKSSDGLKEYMVTNYRPNRWSCSCPDFLYRSHDNNGYSRNYKCKHIKEVMEKLQEGEIHVYP